MRILLAAPVRFDRITLFISDYFVGLANAAVKLGHQVRLVEISDYLCNPLVPAGFYQEFFTLWHHFKKLADLPHDVLLMKQLWQETIDFKPDILVLHVVDTSFLPLLLPKIRRLGIKVVVWLGVHPSKVSSGVHSLLKNADYTLCYDSSYREYYRNTLDFENVFILPLGCDVGRFDSIEPDHAFKSRHAVDVCFAGLFDVHREKYLMALRDFNLGIWSWNINEFDTPLKRFHRGNAYGEDLVRIYKSSKIVLNIHRNFENRGGNYRLFEIPSAGAFQLVDEKPGLHEYFTVGKEIVTFSDEHDLREKVAYFLANEQDRQQVARAGHERVGRDHTLVQRMDYLLRNIMGGA